MHDQSSLLCACGCGTALDFSRGKKRNRFIRGHNSRVRVYRDKPLAERVWPKIDQSHGPLACWPWTGARLHFGYGAIGSGERGGRSLRAHRAVWELVNGPIPDGLWVLHRCDNPPCCNPAHLFIGTRGDNSADMVAKGRGRGGRHIGDRNPTHLYPEKYRGERNGRAKLTGEHVAEVRLRYAAGRISQATLAREYGVNQTLISAIVRHVRWQHVS